MQDRNKVLLHSLVGRTITGFDVDYRKEEMHVIFADGVGMRLWVNDEAVLCYSVERQPKQ